MIKTNHESFDLILTYHQLADLCRKVRKQFDVKGEDMPTIQPALFDLWDLDERCPQVCIVDKSLFHDYWSQFRPVYQSHS